MPVPLPSIERIARPRAFGYGARLDELLLRLAVTPQTPLEIRTAGTSAPRVQTTDSADEHLLTEEGMVFSLDDFTGGEGLYFAHRQARTERDPTRFWSSVGIDCGETLPGELSGIRLAHIIDSVWSEQSNAYLVVMANGDLLFSGIPSGGSPPSNKVWFSTNPLATSPGRSEEDPYGAGPQTVRGLARLGDEVFAALGTDLISKRNSAGTWAQLASAPTTVGIWSVKGRILAATGTGNVLADINLTTGTPTSVITLAAGYLFTSVVDAGAAILAAASNGIIYSIKESGGTVTLSGQSRISAIEYPTVLGAHQGVVLIGTGEILDAGGKIGRLYRAKLSTNADEFILTDIQFLREFPAGDNTKDYSPSVMAQRRNDLYIGVAASNIQAADDGATIWRYQLATGGLSEEYRLFGGPGVELRPNGLGVIEDRLVIGLGSAGGSSVDLGLYRESDSYVFSGYLISSVADFFTATSKSWVGLSLSTPQVANGARIRVYVSTSSEALLSPDHPTWLLAHTVYDTAASDSRVPLLDILGRYMAIKLVMERTSTGLDTPWVSRVTTYAYAQSEELVLRIPVNVSDRIERPNRRPVRVEGWGKRIQDELLARQGRPSVFELYSQGLILRGTVKEVFLPYPGQPARGSPSVIAMLEFRGRLESLAAGVGSGTLGIGLLGVTKLGV
jgi:hypothetical protein